MCVLILIFMVCTVVTVDGHMHREQSLRFVGRTMDEIPRGGGDVAHDNNSTEFLIPSNDTSISKEKCVLEKRKKGKKKSSSNKASVKQTGNTVFDDSIRRIRREWKDVVQLGIGYDWAKSETVVVRRRRRNLRDDSLHSLQKSTNTTMSEEGEIDSGPPNDAQETQRKVDDVRIGPLGKSLFTWHFSICGAPGSSFDGGIYHGRVILPKNYPGSPPRIQVLTPSGRFIVGHDICLSASNYHPETWTPRWTVLSLVQALRLHMLTAANEIGGIESSHLTKRKYAMKSRSWVYPGIVNHSHMITSGDFPEYEDEAATDNSVENEESYNLEEDNEVVDLDTYPVTVKDNMNGDPTKRSSVDVAVVLPNSKQHTSALKALIKTVASVLTDPVRLSLFLLITLFAILNKGG